MKKNKYIIEVTDLSKIYGNETEIRALWGVSFQVKHGDFLAITGPSGSGKSTLLNIIGTLDQPSKGMVIVENSIISNFKGNELADFRRNHIGFVFQMPSLIPVQNALENVMLPLLPYARKLPFNLKNRARELLDSVGLKKRASHLPFQLSGGEQQRVAIARALINSPTIILADEPTGNLDTKASHEVLSIIQKLNKDRGVTVLMVSHNEKIVQYSRSKIHLTDGKITGIE